MHARLWATVAEGFFIEAKEIARRVERALPSAVIDWKRGDEWVESSLQDLIVHQTPEVILEGHRHLFGRTVHISLAYPEWPNRHVYTINSGIQPGLGDNLFLSVAGSFELALLKRAAQDFSRALYFPFRLEFSEEYRQFTTLTRPEVIDALEFVAWDNPSACNGLTLRELRDWRLTAGDAIVRWLNAYEYKDKVVALTAGFPSYEAFAAAAVKELDAIGTVQRAWAIDDANCPYQNRMVLDHGDWTTLLRLSGPAGIIT
jgi:hypothetical protein